MEYISINCKQLLLLDRLIVTLSGHFTRSLNVLIGDNSISMFQADQRMALDFNMMFKCSTPILKYVN